MKNKASKQISEYVNYFPTKRVIIKPFFKCQIDTTNYMLFKQNEIEIYYDDNLYTVNHEQINTVILSMCSRLYKDVYKRQPSSVQFLPSFLLSQ